MIWDDLALTSISNNLSLFLKSIIIRFNEFSKSEFSGNENLLSTWELELWSSESFLGVSDVLLSTSNWNQNLTNVDSCRLAKWFTEGTSHTLLEPICTSARKHLIDSDCVPWMNSDSHVEKISSYVGLHVLVASNSCSFQCFRCDLLLFVTDQVDTCWELIVLCLLLSAIVHSDLWIWYTSVESWFWIWLILLISVASSWSSSHFFLYLK